MPLDLIGAKRAFYDRLATAAAGSTARAALGTVSRAKSLRDCDALPRVLCLFKPGAAPGNARDGNRFLLRWWLYDLPDTHDWSRIHVALPLLIDLYGENDIPTYHLKLNGISDELTDPGTKMPCMSIDWTGFNRQ